MKAILAAAAFMAALAPVTALADQAGYLYSYGFNESGYGDFVFSFDAYKPLGNPSMHLRPYVDVFATKDTKSGALYGIPHIYSDNYGGAAVGLQYTDGKGLRLFSQLGATTKIGDVESARSGSDYRGGVQWYREWAAPAQHGRTYGNFFGSGTYYSRYGDAYFYNQLETGTHAGSVARPVDLYLRGSLTMDTHPYFYGNAAEAVGGVRFHPFGVHGPSIAFDYVQGTYLRGSLLPAGTSAAYHDFRPTVAYGVNI